jgi:hypothetical protein
MSVPATIIYACFVLAWLWVCSNVSIEWTLNKAYEDRRREEAYFVVRNVCDTIEGASLAGEFAKCEDARIILMDTTRRMVWMKAFRKTVETVIDQTLALSGRLTLQMFWNCALLVLMLGGLGKLCDAMARSIGERDERDVLSPVARHRLLESSYIDMRRIDPKKLA